MKKTKFSRKELKLLAKKLTGLLQKGLDKRSIEVRIIVKRIKFLIEQVGFRRRQLRRVFGATVVFLSLGFVQNINAQATFISPVTNPFGLTNASVGILSSPAPVHADLDNDGDLDILVSVSSGSGPSGFGTFKYYQNIGTASIPNFAAPISNPFGLSSPFHAPRHRKINLVDIDNDGDLDIFYNLEDYNYYQQDAYYIENIGSATAPNFNTPAIVNPFGMSSAYTYSKYLTLVDIDNDGDSDLFSIESSGILYQENVGTLNSPNFGTPQLNPFNLVLPQSGLFDYADLDNDGDLDLLSGETYANGKFRYYENTGSATVPFFAAPITNPFGLVAPSWNPFSGQDNNPTVLDLDGDGDLDILTGDASGDLVYYENVFITSPIVIPSLTLGIPTCSPGGDATITAQAFGGVGPYTYKIGADSNTTGVFTNYSAGTYTLRIRDNVNTILDSMVTINIPIPPEFDSLNSATTNLSCNASNDGAISLSATAGTLPYTFALLPGSPTPSTQNVFNNLSANNYTAIIIDSNNCSDTTSITIAQPTSISITTDSLINVSCFGGSDGKICFSSTGGTAPYSYNPAITSGCLQNLTANSYTIIVTDSNGCVDSLTSIITEPPQLNLIIDSLSNVSCFGGNDGKICMSSTGGTAPYSYNPAITSGCLQNLTANSYTITVTDSNGCVDSLTSIITEPPQLNLIIDSLSNVSCFGGNDGKICVSTAGGAAPYTYNPTLTNACLQNLTAAVYNIVVTDTNNCSDTLNVTITEPPQMNINVSNIQNASTTASSDGGFVSSAFGGGGGGTFIYSIVPNIGSQGTPGSFTGLMANTYTVTATDANTCTTTSTVTIGADAWPVAVNEIEKNKVKVYPNPFTNLVKIESAIEITSLTVLDVTGKTILELKQPEETISLQNLPTGIYVLKLVLKNEDTVYTRISKQ